jgi:hypothetical protein
MLLTRQTATDIKRRIEEALSSGRFVVACVVGEGNIQIEHDQELHTVGGELVHLEVKEDVVYLSFSTTYAVYSFASRAVDSHEDYKYPVFSFERGDVRIKERNCDGHLINRTFSRED